MTQGSTIVIDPVTRIEGHSKITLHLDEDGRVEDAHFHVTQFRGFEKFCEGRPFYEMPSLMARICGICPVSHLIASAKACDSLLAVRIPPTADKLRRIFGLAQVDAVARSQSLPSFVPGPAARHGRRPGQAQHLRRGREESRARARRHPPAPVRPEDHRAAGRQAHPSRRGSFPAASASR